jgi:beta-glucosidase
LPVTFYRGDKDLPGFNDYSMKNRTYRYFTGQPQYGFGYGLSYTNFSYNNLRKPAYIEDGGKISLFVKVTNKGKMDGEEVVQLYISGEDENKSVPIRSLRGFQRLYLKKGQSVNMRFILEPGDLSYIDDNGNPKKFSGKIMVSVGGSQPGEKNVTKNSVAILRLQ